MNSSIARWSLHYFSNKLKLSQHQKSLDWYLTTDYIVNDTISAIIKP